MECSSYWFLMIILKLNRSSNYICSALQKSLKRDIKITNYTLIFCTVSYLKQNLNTFVLEEKKNYSVTNDELKKCLITI